MEKPVLDDVLKRIDKEELINLAISLSKIYSPPGGEKDVGDFAFNWLKDCGFETERIGMTPERFNVVGRLRGQGNGLSLVFNSHIDSAPSKDSKLTYINPELPVYYDAWVDGDKVYGMGIMNDRGPMATFLIAAKAIKESGVKLSGDLIVTGAPGEIGQEPVDEFQGVFYQGKDIGARYMVTHGVYADYAVIAECTSLSPVWVEPGKAFFKITVFGGPSTYTPSLKRSPDELGHMEKSPNAIPRMARLIQDIEAWAHEWEARKTRRYEGGTVIPKVNIGAIRGGLPYKLARTSELCSIYVDVRILPEDGPLEPQMILKNMMRNLGIPGHVDLILFRRGYEAKNIRPLVNIMESATEEVTGIKPKPVSPIYSSMWRDINAFNEAGIPALTYGPTGSRDESRKVDTGRSDTEKQRLFLNANEMVACSKIFALTALRVCSQERSPAPD